MPLLYRNLETSRAYDKMRKGEGCTVSYTRNIQTARDAAKAAPENGRNHVLK
jgi:hypothetical protein